MNYGEVKTYLRNLINRTDISDDLAAQLIIQSQTRLERRLRISSMESFVDFVLDGTTGDFRLPSDYIEMIDLFSDAGQLERVDTSAWLKQPAAIGQPEVFLQTGSNLRMRPWPAATTKMYFRYYKAQIRLANSLDENLWSTAAVDALVYGAAELAGDYFEDERLQRFGQKFETALAEIEDQQQREDISGPSRIQPAYQYPSDY